MGRKEGAGGTAEKGLYDLSEGGERVCRVCVCISERQRDRQREGEREIYN